MSRQHSTEQHVDLDEAGMLFPSGQMRLRLLQAARGNEAVAQQMQAMLWQDYCAADQPFGASERGMFLWAACEQHTTSG